MKHRDLYLTLAALVVIALIISLWPSKAHADTTVLDSGTTVTVIRTNDPYHYGRQFRIDTDGPATISVVRAQTISSSGNCRTTTTGSSGPHRSPVPTGSICTGPGTVIGDTPVYNYGSCQDGTWVVDNLIVTADGVEVFNDTGRYGPCPEVTTTTTEPPTTTIPPTTTTTIPGTRHCVAYVVKPFRHCVRWSA